MATLEKFRRNSRAVREGEWVRVGDEYDDLEIRTRGYTDAYFDAHDEMMSKAVKAAGEAKKLSSAVRREITVECMIRHLLLDVRNLTRADGRPVTFEEFCGMLRDPDYLELVAACVRAVEKVGRQRQDEVQEAAGNCARASDTILSGAATATC